MSFIGISAMSRFVPVDRDTQYLLPPSVDDWLPENHLGRFLGGGGRPVGFIEADATVDRSGL